MEQVRRGRSSATLDLNINPRRLRLADQNSRERSYVSVQYIDMTINPTYLAQRSRSSINWADAQRRVLRSYREWLRASPEIQSMYSLNMPVSKIRTKVRQEFEKHRYVNHLQAVDVLLQQSHAEFQETLNFWKQNSHIMKYWRTEEDENARLPKNFMSGFLEGRN
ncbi:uncharacterized protein PV06_00067 [Exophiala oligosperma]|uniref:Complex 1 LYR protein domain-containing protein n=1 Tax=Exophiala oligosperma TaxID=215243 RepID=A0A0D2CBR3_9EURO|nr:uncharacterized protein PV06_00067 [Exophiala oligosperma]KIW47367.1 hypothetical protein PV06_00067 [Exophiala oligosperma]